MSLTRILLYVRDLEAVAEFYCLHFGFKRLEIPGDRIVELVPENGGAHLMLHQAAKGQRPGQSLVKLVFDVRDVEAFCAEAEIRGLTFGPVHRANGYQFANAKDPAQNPIQVSSRAFSQNPSHPA